MLGYIWNPSCFGLSGHQRFQLLEKKETLKKNQIALHVKTLLSQLFQKCNNNGYNSHLESDCITIE